MAGLFIVMVMAGSSSKISATEGYIQHGDSRPGYDRALQLYELERSYPHENSRSHGVFGDVLSADLCLDLAVDKPEQRDQWLSRAKSHLRDAVGIGKYWMDRGRGGPDSSLHAHIATAALRLADVPAWEEALAGQPVSFNYEAILERYVKVYDVVDPDAYGVEDVMAEGLLKLAGARQREGVGRHATVREDEQVSMHIARQTVYDGEPTITVVKRNPRWDCSLSESTEPAELIDPTGKVQIKRHQFVAGSHSSANAYRAAGVQPVCTDSLGWTSPRLIIASCWAADEGTPRSTLMAGLETSELMSGDQLDDSFGRALDFILASEARPWQAVNE